MSHPLFSPEVRQMLLENDAEGLKTFCETLHPATIAEALEDDFSVEEAWKVLEQTGIRDQAAVFEYFPGPWQVLMVEGTGRAHVARLIEQMSHDDRVDLLRRLTPRVAEGLLRLVDEADRRDIATLARYGENTVGALMTTDYAWLPASLTAGEAIDRLRQQAPDRETIYYIYVLEEATRKLLGVVSLRDLILAPRSAPIRELMETDVVTLKASDDQEKAADLLARYDFLAIPVVDDEDRLVGIVTHDDVIDVITQEATEDLQRQAGVGAITENYLEAGFVTIWRKRAGWLAALFIAEMFTFNAMAHFDAAMRTVSVLALFVPLCLSVGGNSGSQAATLITRALALGQVTVGEWWRVLRHEILMGVALGLTLGTLGLFRTWLLTPSHVLVNADGTLVPLALLTVTVGLAVTIICLWGTLVGSMLPLVFRRMGIDPGIASSPFIATFSDVTGIIIYFNIARLYLL